MEMRFVKLKLLGLLQYTFKGFALTGPSGGMRRHSMTGEHPFFGQPVGNAGRHPGLLGRANTRS